MPRMRAFLVILVLWEAAFCLPKLPKSALNASFFGLFGGKTQPPPGWALHKQSVDLDKIALKPAQQPCANWAWVAAIADMAEARGARIEQQYLVDRLYGGSVCLNSAGDLGALAQKISHDYVLQDGQKFGLTAHYMAGTPTQPDPLILSIRQGKPLMLLWGGRICLLTGISYDEYQAPTGNKMFIVTELKLFDPAAEVGKRTLVFARDRDNPDDLSGMTDLSIYPK